MNVKMAPFDNINVRQAVAYAIPYQKIMDAVMFGRGKPTFGGPASVTTPDWPQPTPYVTDLAKAKGLLAEAGLADGFATNLSFDLGFAVISAPLCVLVQESLGQIGIKVTLNKIPGADWRAEFSKPNSRRRRCRSWPTRSAAGSTFPTTSSIGPVTGRTRSSTRCPTRTRRWTS
jgi:peptide/nickel transport system substrate-binding protein